MYLAWVGKPYEGSEIKETLTTSLDYLDGVDTTVRKVVQDLPSDAAPEHITHEVLLRIGLDPPPVMPMTVTSIMSHL